MFTSAHAVISVASCCLSPVGPIKTKSGYSYFSRPNRWNHGSPHFRLARNLKKKYCRQIKPRVLPFYCDNCHLATRRLELIRFHPCEVEEKKKKEGSRRYTPYDFSQDLKIAQIGHKSMRKDAMAVMERTPKPQHVKLATFETVKEGEPQVIRRVPTLQDLCHAALEFDMPIDCAPVDEVMTKEVPFKIPEHKKECWLHSSSATFCFRCRELFNNYSDYSEHLENPTNILCKTSIPEYQSVQKTECVGTMTNSMAYRRRRHKPVKRNISDIRCTLCHAGNFESTDALYSHMLKCTP
ncbi:unnamed protein product [Caenorhabditis bovis]|uniref:Uncharacterized protein n=1 Tax=Caenorhabditis bovis TaxID=2654633 RepID=A0A8S1FBI9_9PELO|nr:unnamed protein product [Caenorhabditis bovis]